jgi:hypothetical protein
MLNQIALNVYRHGSLQRPERKLCAEQKFIELARTNQEGVGAISQPVGRRRGARLSYM